MDKIIEKLTYDQIVAIHLAIEDSEEIVFSEKRLQSDVTYLDQFDELELYATHFLCTMICDDIFEKFNVETTLAALDFFLHHNGYGLNMADKAEHQEILDIIAGIKAARELKKADLIDIQFKLSSLIHAVK